MSNATLLPIVAVPPITCWWVADLSCLFILLSQKEVAPSIQQYTDRVSACKQYMQESLKSEKCRIQSSYRCKPGRSMSRKQVGRINNCIVLRWLVVKIILQRNQWLFKSRNIPVALGLYLSTVILVSFAPFNPSSFHRVTLNFSRFPK